MEGDSGAPLDKDELQKLEEVFPVVKDMLTPKGLKSIEEQGLYLIDDDGDYVTPLVDGYGECAYTIFEDGIANLVIRCDTTQPDDLQADLERKGYKVLECFVRDK